MEQLRVEIIEAQKGRADLLKWKLVIVAALGAVGLGLANSPRPFPIVLIGIPLVCTYVDFLCYNLNLRIQLIAEFMRRPLEGTVGEDARVMQAYEEYVRRVATKKERIFVFETWALFWSTVLLSIGVFFYGAVGVSPHDSKAGLALILSGILGGVLAIVSERVYSSKRGKIDQSAVAHGHDDR